MKTILELPAKNKNNSGKVIIQTNNQNRNIGTLTLETVTSVRGEGDQWKQQTNQITWDIDEARQVADFLANNLPSK